MGILNVTPDSFAEAQPLTDPDAAIAAALKLEAEGADLIDIGGESTRPGADAVSADDEIARALPVIEGLRGRLRIPISIDTYKSSVADAALAAGAAMVNDVSGLLYDAALAGVVAASGAAIVLMHTRGRPKAMYEEAEYQDVIGEVTAELQDLVDENRHDEDVGDVPPADGGATEECCKPTHGLWLMANGIWSMAEWHGPDSACG